MQGRVSTEETATRIFQQEGGRSGAQNDILGENFGGRCDESGREDLHCQNRGASAHCTQLSTHCATSHRHLRRPIRKADGERSISISISYASSRPSLHYQQPCRPRWPLRKWRTLESDCCSNCCHCITNIRIAPHFNSQFLTTCGTIRGILPVCNSNRKVIRVTVQKFKTYTYTLASYK